MCVERKNIYNMIGILVDDNMKVKFTLGIGFHGAIHTQVVELPDEMDDDELQAEWEAWTHNYIDGGFTKL